MNLTKRPAQFGKSMNTRTEQHGEELRPAVDVPIVGFMLQPAELNALLEDPKAHETLYRTAPGGLIEPRFAKVSQLLVDTEFANSSIDLWLGFDAEPYTIGGLVLRAFKLKPTVGGLTSMHVQAQWSKCDLDIVPDLLRYMGKGIDVAINIGAAAAKKAKPKQDQLPLNSTAGA